MSDKRKIWTEEDFENYIDKEVNNRYRTKLERIRISKVAIQDLYMNSLGVCNIPNVYNEHVMFDNIFDGIVFRNLVFNIIELDANIFCNCTFRNCVLLYSRFLENDFENVTFENCLLFNCKFEENICIGDCRIKHSSLVHCHISDPIQDIITEDCIVIKGGYL